VPPGTTPSTIWTHPALPAPSPATTSPRPSPSRSPSPRRRLIADGHRAGRRGPRGRGQPHLDGDRAGGFRQLDRGGRHADGRRCEGGADAAQEAAAGIDDVAGPDDRAAAGRDVFAQHLAARPADRPVRLVIHRARDPLPRRVVRVGRVQARAGRRGDQPAGVVGVGPAAVARQPAQRVVGSRCRRPGAS
jgi:hypothetical protein